MAGRVVRGEANVEGARSISDVVGSGFGAVSEYRVVGRWVTGLRKRSREGGENGVSKDDAGHGRGWIVCLFCAGAELGGEEG